MGVLHLNKESFEKLTTQNKQAVLIDFWATWCGPCQKLGPELEAFAEAHPDIIVGKVNVDDAENVPVAVALGVNAIPALFFYKNGKLEKSFTGFMTKAELEAKII